MTRSIARRIAATLVLLLLPGLVQAAAPLRQAFLVQNSGWMEPFYSDPASSLKPLVTRLAGAAADDGEVVVGLFNQADARHPSPEWIYRGPGNHAGLARALGNAGLARKQSGAYADTDFKEALLGAIEVGLEGRPGIIWIVTNNKNSPNNSAEVVARNREFYQLLHGEGAIARIAAFPLKMPVKGAHFQANGLMIYALAYGEPAGTALQDILQRQAIVTLLPSGHARLKPLTEAAVRFTPTGARQEAGIAAGLAPDGRTLVLAFDAGTAVRTAHIQGRFENLFDPYRITSARATLSTPPAIGLQGELSTSALKALDPGQQSEELTLSLSLPPLPSQWSREVLLRSGYQRSGAIDVRLDDQQLQVSPPFIAHMEALFPGDALPDVFLPPVKASSSVTRIPLLLQVEYPVWPAVVVYGGGLLALLGLLLAVLLLAGSRSVGVMVDGQLRQYRLKPFASTQVLDDNGDRIATLKRRLTGAKLDAVRPDFPIRLQ